jgi:hypothetical protein
MLVESERAIQIILLDDATLPQADIKSMLEAPSTYEAQSQILYSLFSQGIFFEASTLRRIAAEVNGGHVSYTLDPDLSTMKR